MAILWKILWFAKTPRSINYHGNNQVLIIDVTMCIKLVPLSWNQIAGIPLDNTQYVYSFYPDVAFVRLSRKILQFHNCGVGIPPNNIICVQFPTRCCFQGKYFKSYSHQCHSYRRDIVSMTWLPQFWSGDSPRQHTHVCVQFLSRCWFRFRLSRKIYNSLKLDWVSPWKGIFSCTSTSYLKTLK